jgi:hypothetical protein
MAHTAVALLIAIANPTLGSWLQRFHAATPLIIASKTKFGLWLQLCCQLSMIFWLYASHNCYYCVSFWLLTFCVNVNNYCYSGSELLALRHLWFALLAIDIFSPWFLLYFLVD